MGRSFAFDVFSERIPLGKTPSVSFADSSLKREPARRGGDGDIGSPVDDIALSGEAVRFIP